jgi:hypothetical protein
MQPVTPVLDHCQQALAILAVVWPCTGRGAGCECGACQVVLALQKAQTILLAEDSRRIVTSSPTWREPLDQLAG